MRYVLPQFSLIIACLLTTKPANLFGVPLAFIIAGTLLGLWALWVMRLGNFNIRPEPREDGKLVTQGPYQWIRHPMYSSVLLCCFGAVWSSDEIYFFAFWILLGLLLYLKLSYEEKLLIIQFPEYSNYKQKTKHLLPYVF